MAAITEPETVEIRHEDAPEPILAESVTTEIPTAPIHTQPEPELAEEPEPAQEEPAGEEPTEESTPDEEPRRRSLLWLWIAIGLIAGGGLGYFFAMNDPSIPDIETIEESEPEIEPVALPEVAVDSIGIASAQTAAPDTAPAETPTAEPAPAVEEPKPQKEAVYDTVTSTRYLAKMARILRQKHILGIHLRCKLRQARRSQQSFSGHTRADTRQGITARKQYRRTRQDSRTLVRRHTETLQVVCHFATI